MSGGLLLSWGVVGVFAQDAAATAEPPKAATPETTAAIPAAAPAVELPPYFTGTNPPAPAPALWPDAGGGAAGYWTTPSAGPVGDGDPKAMTPDKLYDRIAHNVF